MAPKSRKKNKPQKSKPNFVLHKPWIGPVYQDLIKEYKPELRKLKAAKRKSVLSKEEEKKVREVLTNIGNGVFRRVEREVKKYGQEVVFVNLLYLFCLILPI